MRRTLVAVAVIAAVATGCGNGTSEKGAGAPPKDTKLKTAYEKCDPASGLIELGDGNHSLLIHGAGATGTDGGGDLTDIYEDAIASISEVNCLYGALSTPEYVMQEIQATTAMMGRQNEEDDGLTYDWSYHPDTGLDMVIHED